MVVIEVSCDMILRAGLDGDLSPGKPGNERWWWVKTEPSQLITTTRAWPAKHGSRSQWELSANLAWRKTPQGRRRQGHYHGGLGAVYLSMG